MNKVFFAFAALATTAAYLTGISAHATDILIPAGAKRLCTGTSVKPQAVFGSYP